MNRNTPESGIPTNTDGQLPRDRDESSAPVEDDAQRAQNRAPIRQAHDDVEAGRQDTERYGQPNDVPPARENDGDR